MATTTFVNGSTLSDAGWANDADTAAYMALTSVSGSNTITATGPANYALTSRHPISWIQATTNTGATTLNITPSGGAALGAKNIFARGGACVGGELLAGMAYQAVYDGTQYQLISNSAFLGVATATSINFGQTALSYYGEGTWTPAVTFGGGNTGLNISGVTGKYTRIGNTVHTSCHIPFTSKGSSTGAFLVSSMPFACDVQRYAAAVWCSTMTSIVGHVQARVTSGVTSFGMSFLGTGTETAMTDAHFQNASQIHVDFVYGT